MTEMQKAEFCIWNTDSPSLGTSLHNELSLSLLSQSFRTRQDGMLQNEMELDPRRTRGHWILSSGP